MDDKELNKLKITELKDIAKEQNVDVKGLKKDEIIEKLSNVDKKNDVKADKKPRNTDKDSAKDSAKDNSRENSSREKTGKNFDKKDGNNNEVRRRERGGRKYEGSDKGDRDNNDRNSDRNSKFDRNNNRNRNKREREEVNPEDLMPIAGIVDLVDTFGFVRTTGYSSDPSDVFISGSLIKKFNLRAGDAITGTAIDRVSKNSENTSPNNYARKTPKYNPLESVETVNGMTLEDAMKRPKFTDLTALYPTERLTMELPPDDAGEKPTSKTKRNTGRLIDILSPLGKGQRALIVAPPKAGKTIMMQNIANSISRNNPEVHLMVVLVDERPEEVTDMQRSVKGEVISSTFDKPAIEHTTIAELAIERAKRLVELGKDVVILLDSITRLARAYNYVAPTSGRVLSGGVDAAALYPPKKFLGAARNVEEGGSLTIIASALVETGSKMDEVIFEEFKGTGNSEIRLSRELADKRIYPAINVNSSGTRREEWLLDENELKVLQFLHRGLGDLEPTVAIELLLKKFDETKSNFEFLIQSAKTMQGGQSGPNQNNAYAAANIS